jgi:hypothetical protein
VLITLHVRITTFAGNLFPHVGRKMKSLAGHRWPRRDARAC